MGIEPTGDPCEPFTGFEDQGRHQAPITSAITAHGVCLLQFVQVPTAEVIGAW